jgi:hypothetical protein
MSIQQNRTKTTRAALLLVAVVSLALAASASAKLTGDYTRFANCPYKNPEASKCIVSTTEGGEVVLGSKAVPIVNPAVLQGAYTEGEGGGFANFAKFIAATNGETLTKAPQPVPGGLAGLVKCNEITNFILHAACQFTFENGLTGVNATLELARPASEILVSENNLGGEIDTALKLPVKIHLENPFLGASCYVGSSSEPIYWNLTSGTTKPPAGIKPITGTVGELEVFAGGSIIEAKGLTLVDNTWAAPSTNGCGGLLSFILDPIVSLNAGLPAKAGKNTAILVNDAFIGSAFAVNKNDEENP